MPILKIAHRGASGYALENSFEAFNKALRLSVDMIECDVRMCKSGELVLMHDRTIDRTTNQKGIVSKLTLSQIKKIKLKNNEPIPSLEEILIRYKDKTQIMIDIKSISAAPQIVKLVKKHQCHNHILVASTLHPLLIDILIRDPAIQTAISFDIYSYFKYIFVKKLFILPAKLVGAGIVNVYYKFVNKKIVEKAHKYGFKINAYPPKTTEEINYLKQTGVDGIITNFPDKI